MKSQIENLMPQGVCAHTVHRGRQNQQQTEVACSCFKYLAIFLKKIFFDGKEKHKKNIDVELQTTQILRQSYHLTEPIVSFYLV